MILSIKKNDLKVEVDSHGGQLHSICKNGKEYLWQGDAKIWGWQAPILFPIVGTLVDNFTKIRGKDCTMTSHGFLRDMDFSIKSQSESEVVFCVSYDEQSLEKYPFKFYFETSFSVDEKGLHTSYKIKNIDNEDMVYSFGLHPAFFVNEYDFNDYYIEFDKNITQKRVMFSEDMRSDIYNQHPFINNENILHLNYDLFYRTIIMTDIDYNCVWLCNKQQGRMFKFNFSGFNIFAMWQPPKAPFLCLEPWSGMNSVVQDFENLEENPVIQHLAVNQEKEYKMSVEF